MSVNRQLSATDELRQQRWSAVIRLKKKAVLEGKKLDLRRALRGDNPELVRARWWQQAANKAGGEMFYLSNLAHEESARGLAALRSGDKEKAVEHARRAAGIREQAEEAHRRYEVAGFYDAHNLREVILCELREKISAAGGTPLLFDELRAPLVEAELALCEKRAREAEHASSFFDHAEKLSSAPANAPGSGSLQKTRKEPLAKLT